MPRYLIVLGFLLHPLAAAAEGWGLADCAPDRAEVWQRSREEMAEAKPGSPIYVPKPFPRSDAEVIEDYLYQYSDIWADTKPAELAPVERRVFEGIEAGALRFEVARVENWTPLRCNTERERKVSYLVRIFDASGAEIARTALEQSGLFVATATAPETEEALAPLHGLDQAPELVSSRFNVTGAVPQYVETFGTLRCPVLAPCVALRAGDDVLILRGEELFEIRAAAEFLSLSRELATQEAKEAHLRTLDEARERLVSLGGDAFAVAQKLEASP